MNQKLIVVCFAAVSFMLPAIAGAAVQGPCVQCHTMHNSQNGATVNPGGVALDNLLGGDLCVGCHAKNVGNDASGKAAGFPFAPQVDNAAGASNTNAAGYFSTAGAANQATRHNVNDFLTEESDAAILATANLAPGSGVVTVDNGSGTPTMGCQSCHTRSTHHAVTPLTYRMLDEDFSAVQTAPNDYAVNAAGGIGNTSAVNYDATAMNLFCANCHPNFHGNGTQESGTAGTWLLHPTDVSMNLEQTATTAPSTTWRVVTSGGYDNTNDINEATLGQGTAGAETGEVDVIMCITCHAAHGSAYNDLLKYDYTLNLAGDTGTAAVGCETCHSYGANAGM